PSRRQSANWPRKPGIAPVAGASSTSSTRRRASCRSGCSCSRPRTSRPARCSWTRARTWCRTSCRGNRHYPGQSTAPSATARHWWRSCCGSRSAGNERRLLESADNQTAVVPPEAEAVGEGKPNPLLARVVGDVVQVAIRVWRAVVDGRVDHACLDREDGGNQLACTRSAQQMTDHAL